MAACSRLCMETYNAHFLSNVIAHLVSNNSHYVIYLSFFVYRSILVLRAGVGDVTHHGEDSRKYISTVYRQTFVAVLLSPFSPLKSWANLQDKGRKFPSVQLSSLNEHS